MISLGKVSRGLTFCSILVLPVGIYEGDPDSTSLVIGGYGGIGQYASVIRGCSAVTSEEKTIGAKGSSFSDFGGQLALRVPPKGNSPLVIGLRGGRFQTDYRVIYTVYDYQTQGHIVKEGDVVSYSFSYLNPHIGLETKYFGFGLGILTGSRIDDFSRRLGGQYETLDDNAPDASGHLRLGNMRSPCFLMASLNENVPLVSGGGYWDIGLGGGFKRGGMLLLGMSIKGVYDTPGFLAQLQFPLQCHVFLAGVLRYGRVSQVDEAAVSLGIIYSPDKKR